MKFLLITTLTVCVCYTAADSIEPLSQKEKFRERLAFDLLSTRQNGIESYCPHSLTPEQIVAGNQLLEDLIQCGNATIDKFVNKLDDNVNFEVHLTIGDFIRVYAEPACDIFDDIFKCVGPVADFCLNEEEKVFKNKLFGIVPLVNQSICLHTGVLIADIVQHDKGLKCVERAISALPEVDFLELFQSESAILFGDEKVCQRFSDVLKQFYVKVGECNDDVLVKVKDMLGYICERTPCVNYVDNFQCY